MENAPASSNRWRIIGLLILGVVSVAGLAWQVFVHSAATPKGGPERSDPVEAEIASFDLAGMWKPLDTSTAAREGEAHSFDSSTSRDSSEVNSSASPEIDPLSVEEARLRAGLASLLAEFGAPKLQIDGVATIPTNRFREHLGLAPLAALAPDEVTVTIQRRPRTPTLSYLDDPRLPDVVDAYYAAVRFDLQRLTYRRKGEFTYWIELDEVRWSLEHREDPAQPFAPTWRIVGSGMSVGHRSDAFADAAGAIGWASLLGLVVAVAGILFLQRERRTKQ